MPCNKKVKKAQNTVLFQLNVRNRKQPKIWQDKLEHKKDQKNTR